MATAAAGDERKATAATGGHSAAAAGDASEGIQRFTPASGPKAVWHIWSRNPLARSRPRLESKAGFDPGGLG